MFALAATLMIMIVIAGLLFFVDSHIDLETNTQSYARAIHLAEIAANWQINQMSRTLPPGNPGGVPGFMTYGEFTPAFGTPDGGTTFTPQPLPFDTYSTNANVTVNGSVVTWTTTPGGGTWAPPGDFRLYAVGYDPDSIALNRPIAREVILTGTATGLADRYLLFGNNSLSFNSDPVSAAKKWAITSGYIGTNSTLNITNQYPSGGSVTFGCRLGNGASTQPVGISGWPNGWDVVRLPDPVYWPSVSDVTQYIYQGKTPSQLSNVNVNNQIWYRDTNGNWQHFATTPTQLTNAEFSQSPISAQNLHRTICLSVDPNSATGNLFYFTNIQMNSATDVLVLDVGPPPPLNGASSTGMANGNGPSTVQTIRILLNNSALTGPMVVGNLAYCSYGSGVNKPIGPSIIWLNNTNNTLQFRPGVGATQIDSFDPTGGGSTSNYFFKVSPYVEGLAYGGDIAVYGSATTPMAVNSIVGNNVLIDASQGSVSVKQPTNPIETDNFRYVLFYRVQSGYYETNLHTIGGLTGPPPNYGSFEQLTQ
jgi:hypothetical protein